MNKSCKICKQKYEITDDDLEFLDKISPEFASKKYQIPSSAFCPECNQLQHLAWRNERSIYKRKCDKSGAEILSIFLTRPTLSMVKKNGTEMTGIRSNMARSSTLAARFSSNTTSFSIKSRVWPLTSPMPKIASSALRAGI